MLKCKIIDRVVGEKIECDYETIIFQRLWERMEEYGKDAISYRDTENKEQTVFIIERA